MDPDWRGVDFEPRRWRRGERIWPRFHSGIYVYHLLAGALDMVGRGGKKVPIRPGGFFWWARSVSFGIRALEDSEGIILRVRNSTFHSGVRPDRQCLSRLELLDALAREELLEFGEPTMELLPPLFKKGAELWCGQGVMREGRLKGLVMDVLHAMDPKGEIPDTAVRSQRLDGRLELLLEALEKDPARDWSLEEMAAFVKLQKSRFSELFRLQTGSSPMDFLKRARVELACRYLRSSDRSILDIGFLVGFATPARFHVAFKKWMGESPGRWRRSDEIR